MSTRKPWAVELFNPFIGDYEPRFKFKTGAEAASALERIKAKVPDIRARISQHGGTIRLSLNQSEG